MQQKNVIPFKIQSMDSLGQGVCKDSDKITFIPKTLPGETGEAVVYAEKKGVRFAKQYKILETSPFRIEPICPHYQQCPSCHYLHTTYEEELNFKRTALEKMFYKITHPEIRVIPAIRRHGYRNRIQLHYSKREKQLGMLNASNQQIAPIPDCLIGTEVISRAIKNLYKNERWLEIAKSEPDKGHVEIYWINNDVKISWNKPYAEGGFTQVFDEMNQVLKNDLQNWGENHSPFQLLDLFAGNGNLSEKMNYSKRLCVDIYNSTQSENFLSQDLYDYSALKNVGKKLALDNLNPNVLLLDPPRSGLKNLQQWVEAFGPQKIIYVSCDPHTLVRDLTSIKNYQVIDLRLYDFFPSTFHFETVAFLERK